MKPYYQDASVKIYHADCREVLAAMKPGSVDLVLTDPPYGITFESNFAVGQGSRPITNDGTRISLGLYRQVVPLIRTTHLLWFTRWDAWPDVWQILGERFRLRGLLVWDKGHPGMGDLRHWGPSYELIASCGEGRIVGSRDQSVLQGYLPVPNSKRHHPAEKPVALLRYLIEKLDADRVCDPFMGAGTTLLAAKDLGRKAIGIEIEERYCEIAAKRMEQSTLGLSQ